MAQVYHKKSGIGQRILFSLAAFGASQLIGVPFVGGILATLFDGLGAGAHGVADAIEYLSGEDALGMIDFQTQHGAQVSSITELDDGRVAVTYDTTNYSGPGLDADQYDKLGEQPEIDALDQLGETI